MHHTSNTFKEKYVTGRLFRTSLVISFPFIKQRSKTQSDVSHRLTTGFVCDSVHRLARVPSSPYH